MAQPPRGVPRPSLRQAPPGTAFPPLPQATCSRPPLRLAVQGLVDQGECAPCCWRVEVTQLMSASVGEAAREFGSRAAVEEAHGARVSVCVWGGVSG